MTEPNITSLGFNARAEAAWAKVLAEPISKDMYEPLPYDLKYRISTETDLPHGYIESMIHIRMTMNPSGYFKTYSWSEIERMYITSTVTSLRR